MDKFKEWLITQEKKYDDKLYDPELDKDKHEVILRQYYSTTRDTLNKVIKKYQEYHPTTIKLSELKKRLEQSISYNLVVKKYENVIGVGFREDHISEMCVVISNNRVVYTNVGIQYQEYTHWLEELKITNTFIEVDV